MCRQTIYDVILMDARMPGIGGVEAFRRIRRRRQGIRVIIMSAYTTDEVRQAALDEGTIAYLRKPLNIQGALELIEGATETSVVIISVASHRTLTRCRIQGIGLDHLGPNPMREPQPKKVLEIGRSRPRQHVLVYASGAAPGRPLIAPTDGLNSWGKAPLKKHVNTCIFDCPVPGTLQYQFAPTKSDCLRIAERARGYC